MSQILDWTLERLRTDQAMMNWLEERRYEWVPLAQQTIKYMINGASVVILAEHSYHWFVDYLIQKLNNPTKNRPLFPIHNANSIFPHIDNMIANGEFDIALDMLSLSFGESYIFWYIGKSNHPYATIAKKHPNSFMWIMDDEIQNSFFLRSADDLLDIKLMHLIRLFDQTLDAALFGEIEV